MELSSQLVFQSSKADTISSSTIVFFDMLTSTVSCCTSPTGRQCMRWHFLAREATAVAKRDSWSNCCCNSLEWSSKMYAVLAQPISAIKLWFDHLHAVMSSHLMNLCVSWTCRLDGSTIICWSAPHLSSAAGEYQTFVGSTCGVGPVSWYSSFTSFFAVQRDGHKCFILDIKHLHRHSLR